MLNRIILQGNVGRSPTVKLTQDGREIATFSLATNSLWKAPEGKWQVCTEWHRITVFREPTVKWIKDFLKKGDPLYIEGKLTYHHQVDKYGQPRSTAYVVITDKDGRVVHLGSKNAEQAESIPIVNESHCTSSVSPQVSNLCEEVEIQETAVINVSKSKLKPSTSLSVLSFPLNLKSENPQKVEEGIQKPNNQDAQQKENKDE